MLDVHPPEHPAHSWSDFFIHMATICLGLLIAIGLEQTVEWFHMRHRVAETREALAKELESNHRAYRANSAAFLYNTAALKNDLKTLLYLRDHPGTAEGDLPGVMDLRASHIPAAESAWSAAKQTGIVERLPLDEVTETDLMYTNLNSTDELHARYWGCVNHASRFEMVDPDVTHLTREDLGKEIELVEECADMNRQIGSDLRNLSSFRSDFQDGPTREQVQAAYAEDPPERTQKIAAAKARTEQALSALRDNQSRAIDQAFPDLLPPKR